MTKMEKTFTNNESEIELISYTDTKQNIWFKAKDIAKKSSDTFIRIKLWENISTLRIEKATPSKRRVRSAGLLS